MSIFFDIRSLAYEDITTEILVYALRKSSSLCKKFLELIGLSDVNVSEVEIESQYQKMEGMGRPDVCIRTAEAILFVENKPWDESSFTIGESGLPDQINRYAKELCREEIQRQFPKKRILCLLTKQYSLEGQLSTIAKNEHIVISPGEPRTIGDILKDHYAKKGIAFIALTWDRLLDSLKGVEAEDAIEYNLILNSLTEDIIKSGLTNVDPTAESFKANFSDFKRLADEASGIVHTNGEFPIRPVDPILHYAPKSGHYSGNSFWYGVFDYIYLWGMFQWGPNVDDYERLRKLNVPLPSHPFTFNVIFLKDKNSDGYKMRRLRTPIFDLDLPDTKKFFEENGFYRCEEDWATIYIKPFDFGDVQLSELTPAVIADKVIEFAKQYSEACKKFIGLR